MSDEGDGTVSDDPSVQAAYRAFINPEPQPFDIPKRVHDVMCEWRLVTAVYPRGSHDRTTKTYVHRHPDADVYAVTRMIEGKLAGFMNLTAVELHAIGDIA